MSYFNIKEFEWSSTARQLKIDNRIPEEYRAGILELIDNLLDPLREAWGSPIKISSGYRSPALNTAVKGSSTSSHLYGLAADLIPIGRDIKLFKAFVKEFLFNRKFDLCISEKSGLTEWVHLSFKNKNGELRREFLSYSNGRYTKWK